MIREDGGGSGTPGPPGPPGPGNTDTRQLAFSGSGGSLVLAAGEKMVGYTLQIVDAYGVDALIEILTLTDPILTLSGPWLASPKTIHSATVVDGPDEIIVSVNPGTISPAGSGVLFITVRVP